MYRKTIRFIIAGVLVLGFTTMGCANVWVDEDFDDGSAWTQGDGSDSGGGANLDVFSNDIPVTSLFGNILTQTGSVVSSKQFDGTSCYQLQPGQTIAAGEPYMNQQNGNFCYLQYAVNVDPIPAAGDVGSIVWNVQRNVDPNPLVWSFIVKLVSTGSAVNIMAGQTTGTLTQIGTLSSTSDWKFITMRLQYGDGSANDTRSVIPVAEQSKTPGMYFYCSGTTPAHTEVITGTVGINTKNVRTWAFTCSTGGVYIDTLYYDGGLDGDAGALTHSKLEPFDYAGAAGIADWSMFE